MRFAAILSALLWASPVTAQEPAPEANVNERYTVESVEITGIKETWLSKELHDDLQKLVGQKFNQKALDDLTKRVRDEVSGRTVVQKVSRGDKPEHVKVALEVAKRKDGPFDISLSRFLYHSRQGWSGKVVADAEFEYPASVILGLVSDADDLLERYAGLVGGFESKRVVSERVRLRFLFETYHHQWNRATLEALGERPDVPGLYRTRKSFAPTLMVSPVRPLSLSFGTSFQFVQTQFPAARTEAAHAAVAEVRYQQQFRDPARHRHDVSASYSLRAANRTLESDFVYTRHRAEFGYKLSSRRQSLLVVATVGRLTGRAPLFERFSLGNSTTLRGWHKFDVAPLGATRMAHNTLEYRYELFQAFYDTGAVWDRGQRVAAKHAVGFGIREDKGPARLIMPGFFGSVAFPVKSGRMEPIFMIGLNF